MSLIIGTSFNLLLIAGCCILAFIARGLPDNFNECWYIFLCVVATIFIWIAFFTTYFSAFYAVYKAALLAAALIMNSLVVIIAFFGPKIYAIAFIADKDIKITDFEGSVSRGRQTETSVVSHGTSDTNVSEKWIVGDDYEFLTACSVISTARLESTYMARAQYVEQLILQATKWQMMTNQLWHEVLFNL